MLPLTWSPSYQNCKTWLVTLQICKGKSTKKKQDGPTTEDALKLKKSTEIMKAFLKEGELNPEIIGHIFGILPYLFSMDN